MVAPGEPYITGEQLATYMQADLEADDNLAEFESAALAATGAINEECGRNFFTEIAATPRRFIPFGPRLVMVDDFYTTDDLVIQTGQVGSAHLGSAWSDTDYELLPLNGLVNGRKRPYTAIQLPYYRYFYSLDRIVVTARWGWESVPDDIIQATKILGAEFYKLNVAPFGVAQSAGSGAPRAVRVQDNSVVCGLLYEYKSSARQVYLG